MPQKTTHNDKLTKTKETQNGLPVPIHPDDAKDKVFTAILKALLKMGNKPSSPKELANIIVKYKYATLGGATPFATVSSRISQHFKRAAEHNPPRAPLLAKHVDQNHSRKINYSLATESTPIIEEEEEAEDPSRTNSKIRRSQILTNNPPTKKHKSSHDYDQNLPISPLRTSSSPSSPQTSSTVIAIPTSPPILSDEESDGELSDYHEDMLKGDDLDINFTLGRRLSRRKSSIVKTKSNITIHHASSSTKPQENMARKPSFSFNSGFPGEQELWTPFSFEQDFDNVFLPDESAAHNVPFNIATPESISVNELDDYFANSTNGPSSRSQRKSFSSAMLGPNDKSLLQKVLLASASAAKGIPDEEEKLETIKEVEPEKVLPEPVIEENKPEVKTEPLNSSSLMDVTNGEDFVKFEEDEKKETSPQKKMTEILPATPTISAAEILKSMNIQNLNLSALQQMTNSNISSSTFDLAKTMAAYMQSLAKSASANTSPSSSTHAMDLKSILTRFPVLEAFIKKDLPPPINTTNHPPTPSLISPITTDAIPNLVNSTEPIVHTLTPLDPPMYITLIDHVAVCVVVLAKTETTSEYRLMRRIDSGFINGTALLTAGGIETESERSMILSFEMERVRMPKKKSSLFGTWIPLRRAQELAVTCSIQHKLGHFLEDSIDAYFPSPLPIQVTTRKPARDGRLTALALAALRSDNSSKVNEFVVPPISRQSSSPGSIAAAQLQELLMTHPHKALKSNGLFNERGPLLGKYQEKDELSTLQPIATRKNSNSSHSSSHKHNPSDKEESDVDIVNTSDSSAMSSNEEESDTDNDSKKNKMIPTLEEILNRVTSKQPLHIHPRDLQKKRRRKSIDTDSFEPSSKSVKPNPSNKKRSNNNGGKWSGNTNNTTVAIKRSASGSTITIKRPTSNSQTKKSSSKEEETGNVVVEHKSSTLTKSTPEQKPAIDDEDDEDEDIDIGGSDCDDDLR